MRNRQSLTMSLLIGGMLIAAPLVAQAGGTIKGKVTFAGKVPPPKEFAFSKFPNEKFCQKNPNKSEDGKTRLLNEVEVGEGNALKNAVVSVREIEDKDFRAQAKKEAPQTVEADLCEFKPYTGVSVSLGQFKVVNNDADPEDPKSAEGVLHNPHSFDQLGAKSSTEFNIGLAKKGDSLEKTVKLKMSKKGSVLRLQCDQHEYMQGWYLPVTNPHYSVVGEDGTFEIKDVPAGKQKVMAWHPVAGQMETDVEVKDGGTVEANFEIK
jgi:hypothetical protein